MLDQFLETETKLGLCCRQTLTCLQGSACHLTENYELVYISICNIRGKGQHRLRVQLSLSVLISLQSQAHVTKLWWTLCTKVGFQTFKACCAAPFVLDTFVIGVFVSKRESSDHRLSAYRQTVYSRNTLTNHVNSATQSLHFFRAIPQHKHDRHVQQYQLAARIQESING